MGLKNEEMSSMNAAYFVQGVKMSLGTLTESYYMKDDLLFDPPAVKQSPTWLYFSLSEN